ncbi:MAG: DUF3662 and FHA domain-containing protein [Thermoleophilia bacterium]|nr:DUF3662 and FHA domain-containing protein [Thermoleophilia bacterium]
MGLFRRSRSQSGETADSKLEVRPKELARKLIKEMEEHKVTVSGRTSVCNHYTIYVRAHDYDRLTARWEEVHARLEDDLSRHARARKYELPGKLEVHLVCDDDLRPGTFGILARRGGVAEAAALAPSNRRPNGIDAGGEAPGAFAGVVGAEATSAAGAISAAGASAAASAGALRRPASGAAGEATSLSGLSGSTAVIGPQEAAKLGLAHQTIVVRAPGRVEEFTKSRIIVGRARNADFRIEDPNVSRRHAAIFWHNGQIVIEDLDSTNGTMVNGYPVTSTVLRPSDVVAIGNCRLRVEAR